MPTMFEEKAWSHLEYYEYYGSVAQSPYVYLQWNQGHVPESSVPPGWGKGKGRVTETLGGAASRSVSSS